MKKRRKIGKDTFQLVRSFPTEKEANEAAEKRRKRWGYPVKVMPTGEQFTLYVKWS